MNGGFRDGWFVVPHQVIFRDLDFFGHVNNAVYFTYFEWARALYWYEVTGETAAPGNIGFIVARAECDFRQQIEMEPIEICVRVGSMGTTSLEFVYEVRKNGGERLAATGKVVVVLWDWNHGRKIAITEELRRSIHARSGSDPSGSGASAVR